MNAAARARALTSLLVAAALGLVVLAGWARGEGIVAGGLHWYVIIGVITGLVLVSARSIDRAGLRRRESEERFRATFEQAAVGMAHVDLDGTFLRVNQHLSEIVGYSPEEFETLTFQEITHPEDLETDLDYVRRLLAGEIETYSMEKRYFREDGSIVWINLTVSLVRETTGEPKYFIAAIDDISDRKIAENTLRESEERFKAFSELTSDYAFQIDVGEDGSLTVAWQTESFERDFGHSAEQMNVISLLDMVHEDDRPLIAGSIERLLSGERVEGEIRSVPREGGETRWRRFQGEPVWNDDKTRVVRIRGAVQDIHEQRLAEESLRAAEARYRLLVEHIPGITYLEVEDPDVALGYRQIYVSPQIERILGYTPDEWIEDQELWTRVVHPDDLSMISELGAAAAGSGRPYWADYRMTARNGETRWIHDEAYLVGGESGKARHWHGLMIDMTEQKQAEKAALAREAAEQANRAKSEFLSRMSHELRTPLNAILGFAQLMEMDELDPSHREGVEQILSGGRHLLELINEVLDISRVEAGTISLSPRPFEPAEALREAIDLVKPLAEGHRVNIVQRECDAWDANVFADRSRVRQVLLNLLSNAVKYNRPGGSVTIACSDGADGAARIDVADTGIGMTPEQMERLFVPFDRLGADQTEVEGTGLGLALSKRLIEEMGGNLLVESTPGEGSVFSVELPLAS